MNNTIAITATVLAAIFLTGCPQTVVYVPMPEPTEEAPVVESSAPTEGEQPEVGETAPTTVESSATPTEGEQPEVGETEDEVVVVDGWTIEEPPNTYQPETPEETTEEAEDMVELLTDGESYHVISDIVGYGFELHIFVPETIISLEDIVVDEEALGGSAYAVNVEYPVVDGVIQAEVIVSAAAIEITDFVGTIATINSNYYNGEPWGYIVVNKDPWNVDEEDEYEDDVYINF